MYLDKTHTATQDIQDGFYLVVIGEKKLIFRIRSGQMALVRTFGSRTLYRIGSIQNNELSGHGTRWKSEDYTHIVYTAANSLLNSEVAAENAAVMYAKAFGRCYVCNRELTHPDSVATGIGPECAGTRRHVEI